MEKRTVPHVHEDTYWSVVENRRVSGGCVVQRQVLYLVELNNNQRAGWVRTIEALSGEDFRAKQLALFPDDREELPAMDCETILVQLDKLVPVKTGKRIEAHIFVSFPHFHEDMSGLLSSHNFAKSCTGCLLLARNRVIG